MTTLQGWLTVSPSTPSAILGTIRAVVCAPLRVVRPARTPRPQADPTPPRLQPGIERC
ncbi:hypothetical protein [Mycolicibacterium goodii]|uniref:Uncharacterized protein n=1 Tax=Mycolicibacterium goodii TaxID=134601 RepID=A0ABS6HKL1_MYCGD|nr:hypothetical protein [Mycolicibacterium goodii]MBU8812153.1 hypothetical protein [Mycolicibacterium goodii]MBU8815830.1 hypothetical protein [Mycolicibacterium goodii]MBU8822125.1 hypothetical protein [Mycolicibacterium goodii]MBU8831732.1 hypothetical protein [Mycolicibacterium goodii]MBU8834916.1 hypothetical protein [Mycolicibacterium goodii]